jgi:DNA-binding HxlR family transcriptional regulator
MLTQTLRLMERDGLFTGTVHPVVPPKVEYKLTQLGMSLGVAFCGFWMWAEETSIMSRRLVRSSMENTDAVRSRNLLSLLHLGTPCA